MSDRTTAGRPARQLLAVVQARGDEDWNWGSGYRAAEPRRDVGIIGRLKCQGRVVACMMESGGGVENDLCVSGFGDSGCIGPE